MALPAIMRRLFAGDGYGPLLKDDIVSKSISIQDWSSAYDYPVSAVVRESGYLFRSVAQSGPGTGAGARNPASDDGTYWEPIPTNERNLVHIDGTETITGQKAFSQLIVGVASRTMGVAAWTAASDYVSGELAMAANGVLYQAVQSSGPGTSAGAHDPGSDNGTYWQSLHVKTTGLSSKSEEAATTKWVKLLASTPIYVSPSGNDSNDGLSAATPKKTLQSAYNLGVTLPHAGEGDVLIRMAPGSYSGDFRLRGHCVVEVLGNVSISGNMQVFANGLLYISGTYTVTFTGIITVSSSSSFIAATTSWTQTGRISCVDSSYAIMTCPVSITNANEPPVLVRDNSLLYVSSSLTVIANDCNAAISLLRNSYIVVTGVVLVTANNISNYAVLIQQGSSANFDSLTINGTGSAGGVFCQSFSQFISNSVAVGNILSTLPALTLNHCCSCSVNGNVTMHGPSAVNVPNVLVRDSSLDCTGEFLLIGHSQNSDMLAVTLNSAVYFNGVFKSGSDASLLRLVHVSACSTVYFNGLNIDGYYQIVLDVENNSYAYVNPTAGTVTGTATGKRFNVAKGGIIDVSGGGLDVIPGTSPGTVDAATFAIYG